jgi:hypothetical protein
MAAAQPPLKAGGAGSQQVREHNQGGHTGNYLQGSGIGFGVFV